jgi:hypothetical protein
MCQPVRCGERRQLQRSLRRAVRGTGLQSLSKVTPHAHQRGDADCGDVSPGGITCSGWDTRQPNRVLANTIAGDDLEGRPRAGKVRLAAAKYERAEVETIFVY